MRIARPPSELFLGMDHTEKFPVRIISPLVFCKPYMGETASSVRSAKQNAALTGTCIAGRSTLFCVSADIEIHRTLHRGVKGQGEEEM